MPWLMIRKGRRIRSRKEMLAISPVPAAGERVLEFIIARHTQKLNQG